MSKKIKQALAENTANLRVLADRYVQIMVRCDREIEAEKESEHPSPWKIRALEHHRNRAEENIARFKAGPDQLPHWHAPPTE